MPVPKIDRRQSILSAMQGERITFKPFAYNYPTTWVANGLPSDFQCDSLQGIVYGSTLEPGVYIFSLRAHNASGWSKEEIFTIGIENNGIGSLLPAVDVDWDLLTRKATVAGEEEEKEEGEPLLIGRSGDRMLVHLRIRKNGVPLDLPLDSLKFGTKEFDPEELIIQCATFRKELSGTSTFYAILLDFTGDALMKILANYEADSRTEFDGPAEFEAVWSEPWGNTTQTLRFTTVPFTFRFVRELIKNT